MPYAANNQLSTDPIEGGIEITDEQYTEAIDGLVEGKVISIDDGFKVEFPQPPANAEVNAQILSAPSSLFGGPQLRDIFNGN